MLLLFSLTAPPHVADEDHGSEGEGEDQGSLSSPGDGGDEDSNKEGPIKDPWFFCCSCDGVPTEWKTVAGPERLERGGPC